VTFSLQAPKPLLSKSKENLLSNRQKEAIEGLESLIKEGYPRLTMSEIAQKLKVSLRTLYEIAPKKDDLLLIAVDGLLFKIGAQAQKAIDTDDASMKKLEIFLNEVHKATLNNALAFSEDFDRIKGGRELVDSHENYVVDICERFLKDAIDANEIKSINTSSMALLLSGYTREKNKKHSKKESQSLSMDNSREVWEIIFKGLEKD
jgi:AcrR family transcriptional regulator